MKTAGMLELQAWLLVRAFFLMDVNLHNFVAITLAYILDIH